MKKFNLAHAQQQKKEADEKLWVLPQPCVICSKIIHAPYGRWEEGWTCCGAHEHDQFLERKYHGRFD